MKILFLLPLFFILRPQVNAQTGEKITVAVAANMVYAMAALKTQFQQQTGISLEVIPGSSGKLTQQILEGAPYDVFVSADTSYPAQLFTSHFATAPPRIYAYGALVLWTANKDITPTADLSVLLSDKVKKIALANPQTAPYGVAAENVLKYYHIYDKVKDKLVFGESIAQTNQFISTQSADIGFTAKAVVLSDELKNTGTWVSINAPAYPPIAQAAVILKHGNDTNKTASKKFYEYLYSRAAAEIFKQFGYIVQ